MAQNSLVEDEQYLDFDMDGGDLDGEFMGDSPPFPDDPAGNILPPMQPQRFAPKPQTIGSPKRIAPGFQAISMDNLPARPVVEAPPSGAGRLLMRKTIAKAGGSPVDVMPQREQAPIVSQSQSAAQLPFGQQSEVKPNLPFVPKPIESQTKNTSPFDLFTKLPPVPPPGAPVKEAGLPFPVAQPEVHHEEPRPFVPGESAPESAPFVPEPAPFVPEPAPFVPDATPFVPQPEGAARPGVLRQSQVRPRLEFPPGRRPSQSESHRVPPPPSYQPQPQVHQPQPQVQQPQIHQTQPQVQQLLGAEQPVPQPQQIQMAPVENPRPTVTPFVPPVPKTPTSSVEFGFRGALDRSFASVRRIFSKEFSSFVRTQPQNQALSVLDVDDFTEQLTSEIEQMIMGPVITVDLNQQQLARKISSIIGEHTKPMTTILADVDARNSTAAEQHLIELRQLQDEVERLHTSFKSNTDGIIKELEFERQNIISIHGYEHARVRDLEARLNSIKLKQVELETRAAHQQAERENLERIAKQQQQKRQDWEDEYFSSRGHRHSSLRERLLQEIKLIKNETDQESIGDLGSVFEECLKLVKQESESMRSDIIGIEMANRCIMAKIQQNSTMINASLRQHRPRSSVLHEAQSRIGELRRQRESNIRSVADHIR